MDTVCPDPYRACVRCAALAFALLLGACASPPAGQEALPTVEDVAPRTGTTGQQPGRAAGTEPERRPSPVQTRPLKSVPAVLQPPLTPQPAPRPTAVSALLAQAGREVQEGDLEGAAATLERALRIAPADAALWHDLGEIRFHQGSFQQAEAMALRAEGLAVDDPPLRSASWKLVSRARRAAGNRAGAEQAADRARTLQRGGI